MNKSQQLICICIDTSISMQSLPNGRCKTIKQKGQNRLGLAKLFLKLLISHINKLNEPITYSLLFFGDEIDIKIPMTNEPFDIDELLQNNITSGNKTAFEAIDKAADYIIDFASHQEDVCSKRIIAISDCDDYFFDQCLVLCNKLINNQIVMDTIVTSSILSEYDLLAVSKATGGISFELINEDECSNIIKNEKFLSINHIDIEIPVTEQIFKLMLRDIGKFPLVNC